MDNIKFFDMKTRKSVGVPEERTWLEVKGKVKMRVAVGPKGNKMYRIVGRA